MLTTYLFVRLNMDSVIGKQYQNILRQGTHYNVKITLDI